MFPSQFFDLGVESYFRSRVSLQIPHLPCSLIDSWTDVMSPPLFLFGSLSIVSVWLITSLGLSADLWTFGLIPVLSVYHLCDVPKLQEAAAIRVVGPWAQTLAAAIAILFCISWAHFAIHFILWKLGVLLVWLYCMITAFDFEKMMYMTDTYGAVAKSIVWNAITRLTGQARWMTYQGEWAYCCPYTRELVEQEIDHYYTLQTKDEEHDDVFPESYAFDFHIGSCDIVCAYKPAAEDSADPSADHSPASTLVSGPEDSQVPSTLLLQEKERVDELSTASCPEGEDFLRKTQSIMEDHYTLVPSLVNKLEVSLKYRNEALESYTYYDRPREAVAELKRTLNVLEKEGNLIFSSLNRHIGSSTPQAHARCHEFGELLNLILNHNHKLHHVDLRKKYRCIISGHWTTMLMLPVLVWINYYQIVQKTATLPTAVFLLTWFASIMLLGVLGEYLPSPHHTIRGYVHFIIDRFAPHKKDECYRYFQLKAAWLTYGNESYGYPYTIRRELRELCFLGTTTRIPMIGGIQRPRRLEMDILRAGLRVFNLKSLQLNLTVTQFTREPPVAQGGPPIPLENDWQVEICMRRVYNNKHDGSKIFQADGRRIMTLVALMKWIEENDCVGVCKEWEGSLIYAYTHEELFQEVLVNGVKPMIQTFINPLNVTVV